MHLETPDVFNDLMTLGLDTQSTKAQPMLSVVIPLFNKASTIARALDSVATQTDPPEEVIVVDDGSTDEGPEIVSRYLERYPHWRLVRKDNGGVSSARNCGLEIAKQQHVCLLDADDVWLANHSATIKAMIAAHPDCVLYVSGNVKRYSGGPLPTEQQPFSKLSPAEFYARYAQRPGFVHTSAVAVTRSAMSSIGGFPLAGIRSQDVYVWLQLAANGRTCLHPGVTAVQCLDALGLGRRAGEIPYYIHFYSQAAEIPAQLRGDLRRILRRGALASWVASHSVGFDISQPLSRSFRRMDPLMACFFWLAALPGLRTLSARTACRYVAAKAARANG